MLQTTVHKAAPLLRMYWHLSTPRFSFVGWFFFLPWVRVLMTFWVVMQVHVEVLQLSRIWCQEAGNFRSLSELGGALETASFGLCEQRGMNKDSHLGSAWKPSLIGPFGRWFNCLVELWI